MESVGPVEKNERKAIPIGKIVILIFLILLVEIGGAIIYQMFIGRIRLDPLFFVALQRLAGLALVFGFLLKWGYGPDHLGLSAGRIKQGIVHGILWSLGFGLIVSLIGTCLWTSGTNPLSFFSSTKAWAPIEMVTYILVGCLLGPAVEDLVFIGLLYNGLRTRLNLAFSVVIVASLFALAHGWIFMGLIIQFVGGLLFTLSFEFSGSLLTPILIHWSGNLALLAVQLL